jgi:hypothetical protein
MPTRCQPIVLQDLAEVCGLTFLVHVAFLHLLKGEPQLGAYVIHPCVCNEHGLRSSKASESRVGCLVCPTQTTTDSKIGYVGCAVAVEHGSVHDCSTEIHTVPCTAADCQSA